MLTYILSQKQKQKKDVWTQAIEVNSLFGGVWLENVIIKNLLALEMHLGGVASRSGILLAPRSRTKISTLSRFALNPPLDTFVRR